MVLSLLLPILVLCEYGPTRFDSLLSTKTPEDDLQEYGLDHDRVRKNRGFGDLSLVDFNMEADDNFDREALTNMVWEVLDSAHPSVMTLQYAKKKEVDTLSTKGLGHYGVSNKAEGSTDVLNSTKSYLPILYDTKMLKLQKSGYFHDPKEKTVIYATWATFEHSKTGRWFTVINLDLYSAFADNTDIQMMNILTDVRKEHVIDSNPIFFMGNINAISPKLQKVFDDEYINALNADLNAKDSPRFTMRIPVDISNNHERDFILIRDTKARGIQVNYARVLRKNMQSSHYPVHVILSFDQKHPGKEEIKTN